MKLWPFGGNRSKKVSDLVVKRSYNSRRPPAIKVGGRSSYMGMATADYDGADVNRLGDQWKTQPLTADQILERNQTILVGRSQEQLRNNDYAKQYARMSRNNIVGHRGFSLQAKIPLRNSPDDLDEAVNRAVEAAWRDWCKAENCDVTGKNSLRLLCAGAIDSNVSMGEAFFRMVTGSYGGKYGFSLQALHPQRCPMLLKMENLPNGHFVRFGIEYNSYGKPIGYYFSDKDADSDRINFGGTDYTRIPAPEVIHLYREEMVGQRRGLPWLATSLFRARQLNGMEGAALVNARAGANKQGFVESSADADPLLEWETEEQGDFEVESEPGEITVLPNGATFKEYNPQYPNGEYVGFKKSHLQGIASGYGVSYNNLCNDLEGVNFSSIRQGTLDERENWKELQEWMIEQMIQKIFAEWLKRALLGGFIKVNGRPISATRLLEIEDNVDWQARRWAWIDPVSDVKANAESVAKGFNSASRVIRESGNDPETIWQERARDIKKQIDYHIAQGTSKETAEKLVLLGAGYDYHLLQTQPEATPNETK